MPSPPRPPNRPAPESLESAGRSLHVETFLQDLRYGLRAPAKSRGSTTVAALTLALGIGASTAIFSVVFAVLLEPVPYPHRDRLVMPWDRVRLPAFHADQGMPAP